MDGGPVVAEKFVGGSNWSSAYVYTTQQGKEYFVKLAMGGRDDSMFQGEAQGLQAMYGEGTSSMHSKLLGCAPTTLIHWPEPHAAVP